MIARVKTEPARPADAAAVADWLRVFVPPGQVTELRAVGVRSRRWGWIPREGVVSGFFDDMDAMARVALELTREATGVYFIPNPLAPDLLAVRDNDAEAVGKGETATDAHVTARRWLLVDADPVRPYRIAGISSTDAEKDAARNAARRVAAYLRAEGWPRPVVADSGNGWHLLYPIDLPPDDGGFVKRALHAIADKFDSPAVEIDRSVFNPSRLVKLYGTLSRKGSSVSWRPHRASGVVFVPPELGGGVAPARAGTPEGAAS
jgi:hypothetical protein